MPRDPRGVPHGERGTVRQNADTSWEDVRVENEQAREKEHDIQPAERRLRFRCPECGNERTLAETAHDGEVESWENEWGSAWGKDEGPWEG